MTVTQALLDRAIRERREAIEERDLLREAAQAVVDAYTAGDYTLVTGDPHIGVRNRRQSSAIAALRAALLDPVPR